MKLHTVSARFVLESWQSSLVRIFFFLSLAVLSGTFSPLVFADSKSDYDYQYGLYRQSYAEFTVLKKDYLNTASLDNQQKAMLSAKQSILSRDLAKASLAWYIWDLINSSAVDYEPIKPIFNSLMVSRDFYFAQSEISKKIITTENIKSFTSSYQNSTIEPDRTIRYGIVVNKIARLVRIQIDSQTAIDDLIPKLPVPMPITVAARVEELKTMHAAINSKIDLLAGGLQSSAGDENVDAEIFYTVRIEKMQEIVGMQTNWINQLIDLDLNYVQPKN